MSAKVLVVDDEPDLEGLILQRFRRQIRDGSVSFLFAHGGIEALAMLDENRDVDMVLSDINMPGMDGLSLLAKLQESDENLSTVIVSAYGDMANIRTAMNRGAFDFVTKPIDFVDLETTIAKTVRHVGILREARRRQLAAERAHASLSRYFSPNLAERLASDGQAIDLGGQRREIATLFTDVTGFTTLVETLDPEVLQPLLNDYLTGMTEVVFAHDGTVAKIAGEALHVLFGAPGEQSDHATRAVMCSLALNAFAREFCRLWNERGVSLGATRIGVHAGPAIVGNFGGSRFFEYTAYGDTINVAARLEFGKQAARHLDLRERRCCRTSRELRGPPHRRALPEGPIGTDPCPGATDARRICRAGDGDLSQSLCDDGSGRPWLDLGFCWARRRLRR